MKIDRLIGILSILCNGTWNTIAQYKSDEKWGR